MFRHDGCHLVLKTYYRGGVPGRFVRESYLYTGIENTRMWREFHLLSRLSAMGLPVPRPAGARCVLMSPFVYRGELIMEEIRDSRTLLDVLRLRPLSDDCWRRIGAMIADFHRHGVYHHDLNASNILLSTEGGMHLIDFDKCEIRKTRKGRREGWQIANLDRLKRSLLKHVDRFSSLHFDGRSWDVLIDGYKGIRSHLGEAALDSSIIVKSSR